ncbi:unnamed protein product [Ectocarpus sp. CCAP 1310/34]|nr:unnamed protein product [Ectocarpus sp. CCAP 1310/34]
MALLCASSVGGKAIKTNRRGHTVLAAHLLELVVSSMCWLVRADRAVNVFDTFEPQRKAGDRWFHNFFLFACTSSSGI